MDRWMDGSIDERGDKLWDKWRARSIERERERERENLKYIISNSLKTEIRQTNTKYVFNICSTDGRSF